MADSKASQFTPSSPSGGDRLRNGIIALVAVLLTSLVFFGLRLQSSLPTLGTMAAAAIPLETALANGKPSLVEFYADWCGSCQAMVPAMAEMEANYRDRVNFVMLNVDNDKWLPEMATYEVDGIPHFEFFNGSGQAIASTLGEQPSSIMAANLDALVNQTALPYAEIKGAMSEGNRGLSGSTLGSSGSSQGQTDPRSHGAQVKS
jgi:thiol-disulfide isomerase/thioredoxin